MSTFLNSKKWEIMLAGAMPFVTALLDAYQTGAFHGKSVADGLVIAAIIVLRAAASNHQTPAPSAPVPPAPQL